MGEIIKKWLCPNNPILVGLPRFRAKSILQIKGKWQAGINPNRIGLSKKMPLPFDDVLKELSAAIYFAERRW